MRYVTISALLGLVAACALLAPALGARVFNKGREFYRIPGSPGLRVRLTKAGAQYLKQVGVRLLNKEIPNIKGLKAAAKFGQGSVELNNLRVTSFKPAQLSVINFNPPNAVVLGLENMDVG